MELDFQVLMQRARAIGLKDSHITELCDISPGTLSRTKHGTTSLDVQELTDLNELIDCAEVLASYGAPLLWSDIGAVRRQLQIVCEMRRESRSPLSPAEKELVKRYAAAECSEDLAIEIGVSPAKLVDMLTRILMHAKILEMDARKVAKVAQ